MIETRTAILSYAECRESFSFADLFLYLNKIFGISKSALSWHLNRLVSVNLLAKTGRGIYTNRTTGKRTYTPRLSRKAVKAAKAVAKAFPFITVSIFDGNVFADFQQHLSANNLHYIEVDREAMEAVFHFLKREGHNAYLNPDREFTYNNIDISRDAFIVKPLISESPLTETDGVKTPRLEKILVDLHCDDDKDYLHGNEWYHIFNNALAAYSINRTAMLRYASRRNARPIIEKALEKLHHNHD